MKRNIIYKENTNNCFNETLFLSLSLRLSLAPHFINESIQMKIKAGSCQVKNTFFFPPLVPSMSGTIYMFVCLLG